jgi:hypothetical protein
MIDDGDQSRPDDRDMTCVPLPGPFTPSGARSAIEPRRRQRHRSVVRVLVGLAAVAGLVASVALMRTQSATTEAHANPVNPETASEPADRSPLQTTIHTEYNSGHLLGIINWRSARVTVTAAGSTAGAYVLKFPLSASDPVAGIPASCAGFVTSETNNGDGPNDPTLTITASATSDGALVQVQRPGSTPRTITVPLTICEEL